MKNIKYFLFLILVSFSYQTFHCLHNVKQCNKYGKNTVSNCIFGVTNRCFLCEENYSVSYDGTKCINIPGCQNFDEEGKCLQCESYYTFDSNGNCVKDNCQYYDSDGICRYCYPRFQLNSEMHCEKINIDYCFYSEGNICTSCAPGTKEVNGRCIIENLIEGCERYNSDGTACIECKEDYELNGGICTFSNQCQESDVIELCLGCDDDAYLNTMIYQCIGYDGSRENKNSDNDNNNDNNNGKRRRKAAGERINFNFVFICLLLALI